MLCFEHVSPATGVSRDSPQSFEEDDEDELEAEQAPGLKTVATRARVKPTPLYTDNYSTSAKKTHGKRNARSNSRAPLSACFLIRPRLRERLPPDPSGPLPPLSSSSLGQPIL